jgi:hypothetical protein
MLTVAMSALIVTVGAEITASDQGGAFRDWMFIEDDVRRICLGWIGMNCRVETCSHR